VIDLSCNTESLEKNVKYCREKGITLPTFAMMKDPEKVPGKIKAQLKKTGLWDVHPANLYRITWKNEQKESGGLFGGAIRLGHLPEAYRRDGLAAGRPLSPHEEEK